MTDQLEELTAAMQKLMQQLIMSINRNQKRCSANTAGISNEHSKRELELLSLDKLI